MFLYSNYDYFGIEPRYDSWIKTGYNDALKQNYCFENMKVQAATIMPRIKSKYDSLIAMLEKRQDDLEAARKRRELQDKRCAEDLSKQPYKEGQLFKRRNTFTKDEIVLITGTYGCFSRSYPAISQKWVQLTKNTGVYTTYPTNISAEQLKAAEQFSGQYDICGNCRGSCVTAVTTFSEVGGSSGYTNVGGGWKIKNPETYWKIETTTPCTACKGAGFIKR